MRERKEQQEENMRLRNFSARLLLAMEKRGMNQVQLAAAADVTQSSLSRYLKAQQEPRLTELLKLSKALGQSIEALAGVESLEAYSDGVWKIKAEHAEQKLAAVKSSLSTLLKKI